MTEQEKQNLTLALDDLEEDLFHAFTCADEAKQGYLAQTLWYARRLIKDAQKVLSEQDEQD